MQDQMRLVQAQRQGHTAIAHTDACFAAFLAQVKLKLRALQAGQVGQRTVCLRISEHGQLPDLTVCCVVERFICFLPCSFELVDLPLWLHARQHGT